jgi:adenosine deaminase
MANGDFKTDKTVMKSFPKIELHRHLEGSFSLPTLHRIAEKNDLGYSRDMAEFKKAVQFPRDSEPDFLTFLSKFKNNWYRSHQDVWDIVHDSVLGFADDGLFYIELRFSPEHFALFNDFDRMEITRLVIKAANTAATAIGLQIRYLITFNRGKQDQYEMIDLYHAIRDLKIPEIVGIDLAGDETQYPPENFTEFFTTVRDEGLYGATIHAGEVTPSHQIWDSIKLLHAARIGHGTTSIEDPDLQTLLREKKIVLEQCITSNYQTGSWVDEHNHPLGRLYRAGIPVTINSDDPTIQDTDLTDDYMKACSYFDLSVDDLVALNVTAIEGSFLNDADKAKLMTSYRKAIKQFRLENNL